MKNKLQDLMISLYVIMPKMLLTARFKNYVSNIAKQRNSDLQQDITRLKWQLNTRQQELKKLKEN